MKTSDKIANIASAMIAIQSQLKNFPTTGTNPHFNSKYAQLNEILDILRPLALAQDCSIVQDLSGDGKSVSVSTTLLHKSGEYLQSEAFTLPTDKLSPQGAASASTYGRRYSLLAFFGACGDPDDDGNFSEDELTKLPKAQIPVNNKFVLEKERVTPFLAWAKEAGLKVEQKGDMLIVTGKTYDNRETLKSNGFIYNKDIKGYFIKVQNKAA